MHMDFDTSPIHPNCQLQARTPLSETQYHALYPQQSSFWEMNRTPRLEGISFNQIPPENGIAEELPFLTTSLLAGVMRLVTAVIDRVVRLYDM